MSPASASRPSCTLIPARLPHSDTVAKEQRDNQNLVSDDRRVALRPSQNTRTLVFIPPSPASFRKRLSVSRRLRGRKLREDSPRNRWNHFRKIRSEKVFSSLSSCVGNVRAICFLETAPLHSNFPFNDPHRGVFIKSSVCLREPASRERVRLNQVD